jgi:predicted DCC family thiol-disulfide oxidoreductase YuxK
MQSSVPAPIAGAPRKSAQQRPIIFFDGVCHLCNAAVDMLVRADTKQQFLFASLQGETARELLPTLPQDAGSWSIVYLHGSRLLRESDAALEICRRLGGWWSSSGRKRHAAFQPPRSASASFCNLSGRNLSGIHPERFTQG